MENFSPHGIYQDRIGIAGHRGTAIVIDVLRAFTTAAYAFANGAEQITLTGTVDEALALKEQHPDWLLMGEDGGKRLPRFDFSNSPVEIAVASLAGRSLIQRTTAGTQGVLACGAASRVLVSGLLTASATAKYAGTDSPHYVITGSWPGRRLAGNDDWWTAALIERVRTGQPAEADKTEALIRNSAEAAWTLQLGAGSVDPLDVEYALKTDLFDFAMEARQEGGRWVVRAVRA